MCYGCTRLNYSNKVWDTGLEFEQVSKTQYNIRSYGDVAGAIKHNTGTKDWYVSSIRHSMGAENLYEIAAKIDELNGEVNK